MHQPKQPQKARPTALFWQEGFTQLEKWGGKGEEGKQAREKKQKQSSRMPSVNLCSVAFQETNLFWSGFLNVVCIHMPVRKLKILSRLFTKTPRSTARSLMRTCILMSQLKSGAVFKSNAPFSYQGFTRGLFCVCTEKKSCFYIRDVEVKIYRPAIQYWSFNIQYWLIWVLIW